MGAPWRVSAASIRSISAMSKPNPTIKCAPCFTALTDAAFAPPRDYTYN
jgi:hypothetical protein